jgi:predicted ATP-grasp superfamily ATP-dependent carboligase
MCKVLIPEEQKTNVLATLRSLGREMKFSLGHSSENRFRKSRYLDRVIPLPDPKEGTSDYVQAIVDIQDNYDVLLPFGHYATAAVSLNVQSFDIPHPIAPYNVLRYGHDKGLTFEKCISMEIDHPDTEFEFIVPSEYPVVIKARKNCGVASGIRYARNRDEFRRGWMEITNQENIENLSEYHNPIIQEYIPGEIHDCVGLYQEGKCKAILTQRRVETCPIEGGPGAYDVTTRDTELMRLTMEFLDEIPWHGPFQLEWKLDPRDGRFKLIEFNPKMWGTLELAIKAGMNIPKMAIDLALGKKLNTQRAYEVGSKHMWPFPQIWKNLLREPTLGRLAQLFYMPVDIRDPAPDLKQIGVSLANWSVADIGSKDSEVGGYCLAG